MQDFHRSPAAHHEEALPACKELDIGGRRDVTALLRSVEVGTFPLTQDQFSLTLNAAMELMTGTHAKDGKTAKGREYKAGEYVYPPRTRIQAAKLVLQMARFNLDQLPKLHAHLHAIKMLGGDEPKDGAEVATDFDKLIEEMTPDELDQLAQVQEMLLNASGESDDSAGEN